MCLSRPKILILLFILGNAFTIYGQGFGRNKPKYKKFDFEVYETPHYNIYHYFENGDVVENLALQSERWYNYISEIMDDTIAFKNPIVFFADHGDFQQTNTISGTVGVTTGGVTEAFKNRVTLPITLSNQKTNQVLGHELVHAFQYDLIINGDSTNLQNMSNLPLFMVEGMAEYISRGSVDPFTSMWMRDNIMHKGVPSIKDLTGYEYFPYRYGQAFWSVMSARYGDEVMPVFLRTTAKYGLTNAVKYLFGMTVDSLSQIWQNDLKNHFDPYLFSDHIQPVGKKLLDDDNAGKLNLSPSLSPNGRYVIFLSEKGIFTTELYLADARTGKVMKKIASTLKDGHIDHIDAFESSGTWSPDSKRFAFVGYSKGRSKIYIKNAENAKDEESFFVEGVEGVGSPAWSPDGKTIVVSGLKDGQVDLFQINVKTKKVTQLTNDIYAEMLPDWHPSGQRLVFATDEVSMRARPNMGPWHSSLAELDFETGETRHYHIFPNTNNFNPVYDELGQIWFVSDRDGYRNLYTYVPEKDSLFQQTELITGISGISDNAQAISVGKKIDRVTYTHYQNGGYVIYAARPSAFLRRPADKKAVDQSPGLLPGFEGGANQVNVGLATLNARPAPAISEFNQRPYKPKLSLDAVAGNVGVGTTTGGLYGTQAGAAGGIQMLFSDVLGDHQVGVLAALNGEIQDIGAGAQYINKKSRFQWGFSVMHSPPQRAVFGGNEVLSTDDPYVYVIEDRVLRIFEDQASLMASYPFSTKLRLEGNIGTTYRYYGDQIYRTYITNLLTSNGYVVAYNVLGQERDRIKHGADDFTVTYNINGVNYNYLFRTGFLHNAGIALVGDNSYFGMASPMAGHRFRLGVDQYMGIYEFTAYTLDIRKYFWLNPISVAIRGFHYARGGQDENRFTPIFIGWQGLVRGLNNINSRSELFNRYGINPGQLEGSKLLMGQFEVRLPFTGPEQLALIRSNFLFTELATFLDAGVAYDHFDEIAYSTKRDETAINNSGKSIVFMTAGLSLRLNLFGALILEPYYAVPLRENAKGGFGLNFLLPGW